MGHAAPTVRGKRHRSPRKLGRRITVQDSGCRRRCSTSSASVGSGWSMATVLSRAFCPRITVTRDFGTEKLFATHSMQARLALPSTGGAFKRRRMRFSCKPAHSVRAARGWTCSCSNSVFWFQDHGAGEEEGVFKRDQATINRPHLRKRLPSGLNSTIKVSLLLYYSSGNRLT